jgi:hypothetical protein
MIKVLCAISDTIYAVLSPTPKSQASLLAGCLTLFKLLEWMNSLTFTWSYEALVTDRVQTTLGFKSNP